jgi:hypothetical protein
MLDFLFFAAAVFLLALAAWIVYALRQTIKEDRENE